MTELLGNLARSMSTPPSPQLPSSVTTPNLYKTVLKPEEEQAFQSWVKANRVPWQDSPDADYDMRGFWKAQQSGDPNAKRATNLHFPDTYKTPWHRTFSNESMYATPDAPKWVGNVLMDNQGRVVADESKK